MFKRHILHRNRAHWSYYHSLLWPSSHCEPILFWLSLWEPVFQLGKRFQLHGSRRDGTVCNFYQELEWYPRSSRRELVIARPKIRSRRIFPTPSVAPVYTTMRSPHSPHAGPTSTTPSCGILLSVILCDTPLHYLSDYPSRTFVVLRECRSPSLIRAQIGKWAP